jgi:hypothetical protein
MPRSRIGYDEIRMTDMHDAYTSHCAPLRAWK